LQGFSVAAGADIQGTGDAANRRHADAGLVMDLAIGQAAIQKFCDMPSVGERLQFGRGTQIGEECAQLAHVTQTEQRAEQRLFRGSLILLVEYAMFFLVLLY
jgi:hypothetical protein